MFLLSDLVSARTWLALIHHLVGLFLGCAAIFVVTFGLGFGGGMLVLLVGLPVLGLTLRLTDWFARAERARFDLLLGVRIPAWPAGNRAGYRWGLVPRWRLFTERATWGEIGYAFLRLPVSAVSVTVSIGVWALGLAMLTVPFYNHYLPSGGARLGDTVLRGSAVTWVSVIGLAVVIAAPQLTRGLATADTAMSRWLLGPPSDLAARVSELEISRERVVDAAEGERRRIERDLHDGAQQRLVSLAMELGRAQAKFADDPDGARVLVDQAHAQAKEALPDPGRRARRRAGAAQVRGGGGRLLHGGRGADQRGQALPRQPGQGRGGRPRLPGHADRHDQ
jgi:signal transduction histidine kinase